ncbi:MAG: hypothetical protein ACRD0F_10465, partial [Acidimicrobiales bacterium]
MAAATWAGSLPSAGAQANFGGDFAGYSTGTAIHTDATLGTTALVDVEQAFSANSTNSAGLATPILNEMAVVAQPALPTKQSYGQGTGLQVGVGTTAPIAPGENQILLAGLAEANAAPTTPLVTRQIGPVSLPPVAFANVLRGQAAAAFNPNSCVIGQPLSFGLGYADDTQLVGAATPGAPQLTGALISTDNTVDRVSQSRSLSYLVPNGDGTFGLVSETRQTIAPISVFDNQLNEITIELLGEFILRATATGKPGGASVTFAPAGAPTPTTPILTISQGLLPAINLNFQQLFGVGGLVLTTGVLDLAIAEDPRAIGGSAASTPTLAADGTLAAGAADVVRAQLLPALGLGLLDLRLGHMEAAAQVPAGGIRCNIPVSKTTNPDPVLAGQRFTWTISIPSSATAFADLACDLVNIDVIDRVRILNGDVRYRLVSASSGGVISGTDTVTWTGLGPYTPGAPPITLTIVGEILPNSEAGLLENRVDVTALVTNCTAGAGGSQLVGDARLVGTTTITGFTTVNAPQV